MTGIPPDAQPAPRGHDLSAVGLPEQAAPVEARVRTPEKPANPDEPERLSFAAAWRCSRAARAEIQHRVGLRRAELERQFEASRAHFDEAQERIRERTGRDLIVAIIIGLALGGLVTVGLFCFKQWFFVLVAITAGLGSYELTIALRRVGIRIPLISTLGVTVLVITATQFWGSRGQLLSILGGLIIIVLCRAVQHLVWTPRGPVLYLTPYIAAACLVQFYVALLSSFAVLLTAKPHGEFWFFALITTVVAADTGAYGFGLLFGKHPMAPMISPKKSWEGGAGGLVSSVVVASLLMQFLLGYPWWIGLIFGVCVVLAATLGDLVESLLKRDIGIKDMSSLLPGHGGILDRVDSILPTSVVGYILFHLLR